MASNYFRQDGHLLILVFGIFFKDYIIVRLSTIKLHVH